MNLEDIKMNKNTIKADAMMMAKHMVKRQKKNNSAKRQSRMHGIPCKRCVIPKMGVCRREDHERLN